MQFIDKQIAYFKERKKEIINELVKIGANPEELEQKEESLLFQLNKNTLKELKIACVMDRFTLDSYAPECNLLELTPDNWKQEIDSFQPDLVFIESAWQGKDKLWYRKIANGSKEYFEMTSYCQTKGIPIVFWNKEDPVYTDTFMPAARMADFVFTTDIDCIKKYKDTLKHDRVYLLHFAAQPQVHNPIEKYERKDKFCFAGAYYHKYKERSEVFDKFSEVFINTKGFDIYDRNYKNSLPEHAFPKRYDSYILGNLDPKDIDIAYKGYNYGINMNSVNQSQTMFARRVFEMLASNTVTVGNYSRGVKNFFGDLTICTNDCPTMEKALNTWCKDEETYRKYRLLGLRKVLQEHLYEDRLAYIVEKVFQKELKQQLPTIHVFAKVKTDEEIKYVQKCFERQSYQNKMLHLITEQVDTASANSNVSFVSENELLMIQWSDFKDDSYLAVWNVKDYYGENYLLDLVLTLRYGKYHGIGKTAYYKKSADDFILHNKEAAYKTTTVLPVNSSIISKLFCIENNIAVKDLVEQESVSGKNFFSIDEFNYCKNCNGTECAIVDDLRVTDQGISLEKINSYSEKIKRSLFEDTKGVVVVPEQFMRHIEIKKLKKLTCEQKNHKVSITSNLNTDENEYIYVEQFYEMDSYKEDESLKLLFEGSGSADFLGVCVFYDKNKKKLSPVFVEANRLLSAEIPKDAVYFKLGFRFRGAGEYEIVSINIGVKEQPNEKAVFLSRSNVLVLSNQYPSPDNLYRNMFVHQRMSAYKKDGYVFDVMRMNIYAKEGFSEFEGINIVEGQSEVLDNILSNGAIDTVCVHFLDRQMWEVLRKHGSHIRVLVWVHGAEIQPWWRREYNYKTELELEKAKKESNVRMQFWKDVFSEVENINIHFVFVSQYFADEIFADNKIQLVKEKYSIIHNCIDAEIFTYEKKNIEQRKKLLSIRPYASNKYANDLTVKCILELSKKNYFNELEFLLIGNGEYFDEILKPLKKFKNVTLRKTFLRQDEIAKLHKNYGIFITPTRMDAQGVSRDEAMSSGLIPVTNAVTAIPEFVDDTCGILAEGEDYMGMAEGIEKLYKNPEIFEILSENAAARVRKQTTKEFTIDKELKLISGV